MITHRPTPATSPSTTHHHHPPPPTRYIQFILGPIVTLLAVLLLLI